jgi:protein-tyrosine phosphatase
MQATAGSFTGLFGQHTQRFSEWMLEQGLIHIVATDAHGPTTRPPSIRPAFDRISELVGEERALIVCCRNPARVSRGALVPANPYEGIKSSKHSIFTKLPWLAFFNKRRKVA